MADLLGSEDSKKIIENYFGFRENPFGVTPDPRYFYDHSMYMEGLSQLIYGIQARKGFLLLTGDGGTGKTILARKLMRHLPTTKFITVSSRHLTTDALLEVTTQELAISAAASGTTQAIQQLERALIDELKQKRYVALLIDEAQELSEDTLQGLCELSNLETDKEKLLQILLVAQPELVQRLSQPGLQRIKQRIAMHYRLTPLPTQNDVEQYIRHRLEVAGYAGAALFDLDAVEAIWSYTNGTPRLINALCDNTLPLAAAAGRKKVTASMVEKAASLLMLERRAEAAEKPTTQPDTAKPAEPLESAARPRVAPLRPEISDAKIVEEPAPTPKPTPTVASEPAPQRQPISGLDALRQQRAQQSENADLVRLKAAMASIKLPSAPPQAAHPNPVPPVNRDKETLLRPRRPENVTPPIRLSSEISEAQITSEPSVVDDSGPVGVRTIIAKDMSVPTKFFDFMVHEATEALGPIGEFVVQEHISGMGESRDGFPRKKLQSLVEAVSGEIGNKTMRANFEMIMRREIRGFRTF